MQFLKCSFLSLALALMVLSLGCDSGVELGDVSGTVTLDGNPVAGAEVYFDRMEAGQGTSAIGGTNADGVYTLHYPGSRVGAPLGEYAVRIVYGERMDEDGEAGDRVPIPACYNSKTTLKYIVESGDNTANFDLKSAGE